MVEVVRGSPAEVEALRDELIAVRRRLDDVSRLVSDWVWETDEAFRFTAVSERAFELLHRSPQEIKGLGLFQLIVFADAARIRAKLAKRLPFRNLPGRITGRDGRLRHVLVSGLPVFAGTTGAFEGYRGTVRDITRRRLAEQTLRRREAVLEAVSRAATVLLKANDWRGEMSDVLTMLGSASDVDHIHVFEVVPGEDGALLAERRFAGPVSAYAGYAERLTVQEWAERLRTGDVILARPADLGDDEQQAAVAPATASVLCVPIFAGDSWWGFIRFDRTERSDQHRPWLEPEIDAVKAAAGIIGGAIHRHRADAAIRHQAHHDQLTGLPNRTLFFDRLSRSLGHANTDGQVLTLLLIDLDQFHLINDAHGHSGGDVLLRGVAERLSSVLRPSDTAARLASDEFALLLASGGDRAAAAPTVHQVWRTISQPFYLRDEEIYIHASVGAAVFPDNGTDEFALLKNADAALTRAKEMGGNTCQFFTRDLNNQARTLVALTQHLRQALPRQQFELFYQPVIELPSHRVVGAEALLRWRHPTFGMVPPSKFIPLAEEGGLIEGIGSWVLREACRQGRAWRDAGFTGMRISVNVSGRQLQRGRLLTAVFAALSEAGLPPSGLCIEITESAVLADVAEAKSTLERLSQMGVAIVVDDFGTGYASLTYLRQLPLAALKIDRTFIRDLATDPDSAAIVDATVAMAHRLNLKVVAEGVEGAEQLAFLRDRGCEMVQGYYFSRPVPAPSFEDILHDPPFGRRQPQAEAPAATG